MLRAQSFLENPQNTILSRVPDKCIYEYKDFVNNLFIFTNLFSKIQIFRDYSQKFMKKYWDDIARVKQARNRSEL